MINVRDGIYGFIVGDALGVPVEFSYRFVLEKDPVRDMREFGTHFQPKGTWSDDSSMMIATIDSLICKNGYNINDSFYDMADKFVSWYKDRKYTPHNEVFDIGGATRKALNNYINNRDKLCGCGEISDNGNGSLMRILPLAYYFYVANLDIEKRKEITFEVSSITHSHIISKYGCLIYIEFVLNILKNRNNLDLLNLYSETVKEIKTLLKSESREVQKTVEKAYKRVLDGKINKEKYENIKSSGYVVDTLEAVIWTILNSNDYSESVLKAVNLGDDTDTVGALAGGIAGIIYGEYQIPKEWRESIQGKDYIDELISSFEKKLETIRISNNVIDLKILQETIDDLKNNPKACELIGGETSKDGTFSIPSSNPSKQLSEFMKYIYDNDLIDKNYLENNKKIEHKDINNMNFNETMTAITYFLRGERFCSGFWYSNFKDGTILKLLERLRDLIN